jgi:thioredoxin 1
MNNSLRIAIVVVLVLVVATVLQVKSSRQREAKPVQQEEAHAETTSTEASAADSQPARSLPRVVDLGSTSCIPCRQMAPELDELREEYKGRLQVDFYDVRKEPKYGKMFNMKVMPTQVFLSPEGEELWRHIGVISKEQMVAKWHELGYDLEEKSSADPIATNPAEAEGV